VSAEQKQILIAAQERARRVLSEASARAKRLARDKDSEAVSLLLEQQRVAEGLLVTEREDLPEVAPAAKGVDDSIDAHRSAAEVLMAAEAEAATKTAAAATDASVQILMAGHREAAAILLDAWMQVTEGRSADGKGWTR
jgi:hypothetical protein